MTRGSTGRVIWALGALLAAAIASAPGAAEACGSAVYLTEVPQRAPRQKGPSPSLLVAQAERELSEGRHDKAAAKVVQAFPALKLVKAGQTTLSDRALRVMALAAVRSQGKIEVGGFKAKSEVDRARNLEWSVDSLRALNEKRSNNPSYQTDLGEAMAQVRYRRPEAARILGDLASRDLVTTAEGYAALARLRAENGDNASRDELLKRCQTMTKTPAICTAPLALESPRVEG